MCGKIPIPGDHFIAGYTICLLWLSHVLNPAKKHASIFSLILTLPYWVMKLGLSLTLKLVFNMGKTATVIPGPRAMTTLGTRKMYGTMSLIQHLSRAFTSSSDALLQVTNPK